MTTDQILELNHKDSFLFSVGLSHTPVFTIDYDATASKAAPSGCGGNVLYLFTTDWFMVAAAKDQGALGGSHAIEKASFSLGNTLRIWKGCQAM